MKNSYILLNKPQGCITARKDLKHKTVMDYFPECMREALHPVGRLDKDTEGLLFVTDDGKWNQYLMSPQGKVLKEYFFVALGKLSGEWLKELEEGIILTGEQEQTAPSQIDIREQTTLGNLSETYRSKLTPKLLKNPPKTPVTIGQITLSEGRKHQVKRMLKAAGCYVIYLRRDAIGGIRLEEGLPPGEFRSLTEEEIKKLSP